MENIFGSPYDLTEITVDGQKYLITNEDYRWLMEKLKLVNRQYTHENENKKQWYHMETELTTYSENKQKIKESQKMLREFKKQSQQSEKS